MLRTTARLRSVRPLLNAVLVLELVTLALVAGPDRPGLRFI